MAQLRLSAHEFERRRAQVILVCFGSPGWMRLFLEETQVPFRLLSDPDRRVYRAYGLEKSVLRTWSPQTIWYYLKAILRRDRVRVVPAGNPHQLGGDFVLAQGGRVLFAHRSKNPTDRPAVERLLACLDDPAGDQAR